MAALSCAQTAVHATHCIVHLPHNLLQLKHPGYDSLAVARFQQAEDDVQQIPANCIAAADGT